MYIATVPNRNSPSAILLRQSYRENGKVKSRTLANLSNLPPQAIEVYRLHFKGQNFVSPEQAFEIIEDGSPAHGHVDAVMIAMKHLGLSNLIPTPPDPRENVTWLSLWLQHASYSQNKSWLQPSGGLTQHCRIF